MAHVLTFKPIYKERIWGGRNLERLFGRALPDGVKIGESWELADLPEDKSVVSYGPAAGRRIDELVRDWDRSLLGSAELSAGQFPLLVKFLDANDVLSVQVHPDRRTAAQMGGSVRAKDEAWYVIDASPGARVYRGFKGGVTRRDVQRAASSPALAELLVALPARPGDWFYLPGGTVHAIGPGVVLAEVQTPSDTTFRLYDWQRVDPKTGRGRELQVEQALASLNFSEEEGEKPAFGHADRQFVGELVRAPTFTLTKSFLPAGTSASPKIDKLAVWVVLEGAGTVGSDAFRAEFTAGQTLLIPAGASQIGYTITKDCSYLHVELTKDH